MTDRTQQLVAGEPASALIEAFRGINMTAAADGAVRGTFRRRGEIGAPLLRTIERYGAHLISADKTDTREQRHADALLRIAVELAELADRERTT